MRLFILCAATAAWVATGCSTPSSDNDPILGTRLPEITVTLHDGTSKPLPQLAGEQGLVVFFYPKAGTPGCTRQACSLRDAFEKLTQQGIGVVGVSLDSVAAQQAFRNNHRLPFPLISDRQGELARAFNVPVRAGFASRQAFLFRGGVCVWVDRSASTERQAEDILQALEKGIK